MDELGESLERMRREMRMAFGEAPDDHRAWVPHPKLRAIATDESDWSRLLKSTNLSRIDVTRDDVPAELKALLRASRSWGPALVWLSGLGLFTAGVWVLVWWKDSGVWWMLLWIVIIGSASTYGLVVESLEEAWVRRTGQPAPFSAGAARLAAVDALEARPFVVEIEGLLVENVPTLARLEAWDEQLQETASDAEDRRRQVRDLRARIGKLAQQLGEGAGDDGLRDLEARESALMDRVKELRQRVAERTALLGAQLAEVRARSELHNLRGRAAALQGTSADAALGVQTALELDVSDLHAEVAALAEDVADEVLRFRAIGEVDRV